MWARVPLRSSKALEKWTPEFRDSGLQGLFCCLDMSVMKLDGRDNFHVLTFALFRRLQRSLVECQDRSTWYFFRPRYIEILVDRTCLGIVPLHFCTIPIKCDKHHIKAIRRLVLTEITIL